MNKNITLLLITFLFLPSQAYAKKSQSSGVHHYELDYNSCTDVIIAKACADESCDSTYAQQVKKLHIKNSESPPKSIINFNKFTGEITDSVTKSMAYPFTFSIQNADKNDEGADPWPDTTPALRCFVDGVETCTVTEPQTQTQSIAADTGYVAGPAPFDLTPACAGNNSTVNVDFSFTAASSNSPLTLTWPGNSVDVQPGQVVNLDMPLSGVSLSYPQADVLTVTVQDTLSAVTSTDTVAFVPDSIVINNGKSCLEDGAFVYADHADTCSPIAITKQDVNLSLSARDANGDDLDFNTVRDEVNNPGAVSIFLTNPSLANNAEQTGMTFDSSGNNQSAVSFDEVGVVTVTVNNLVMAYIPDDDTPLQTWGETVTIGRTVPAELKVIQQTPGVIQDNLVYAGRAVNFTTPPEFIIQAFDSVYYGASPLTGYSGEFSGGLSNDNISLSLDLGGSMVNLAATVLIGNDGEHQIQVSDNQLLFQKETTPFKARPITEQLVMNITVPKDSVNNQPLTLAEQASMALVDNAELRYGQLMISDLTLPLAQSGRMPVSLHYLADTGIHTRDIDFDFSGIGGVVLLSEVESEDGNVALPDLTAGVAGIDVNAYSSLAVFQIEAEVPDWLKPVSDGELLYPTANLSVIAETNLRGHDGVSYRREAVR